jgi:hypothetical protein
MPIMNILDNEEFGGRQNQNRVCTYQNGFVSFNCLNDVINSTLVLLGGHVPRSGELLRVQRVRLHSVQNYATEEKQCQTTRSPTRNRVKVFDPREREP